MSNNEKVLGMSEKTFRLVLSAVMIAAATALSLLKLFEMPLGGSITLCSMLPILIIGYRYGARWGMLTGFVYGILQMLTGGIFGWGLSAGSLAGSIILDYLVAFSVLGLSGIYGKGFPRYILGMVTAVVFRFIAHVISGVIIFSSYSYVDNLPKFLYGHPIPYSLAYNGLYLLPDLLICLVVAIVIYKPLKKYIEA